MEAVITTDCTDTLLDMVWYQIVTRRLSSEMEEMLERHLRDCHSCRQKLFHLRLEVQNLSDCANFG